MANVVYALLIFYACSVRGLTNCPKLCAQCPCVQGIYEDQQQTFRNIPYAQPPIGKLRFKNPLPAKVYTPALPPRVRPRCVQSNLFLWQNPLVGTENCLYLHVFRPKLDYTTQKNELSVVVYFPHGHFLYNTDKPENLVGGRLMAYQKVIVVIPMYRVGVFGFFSTGTRHAPGNLGLKDQELALNWVHQNIKSFGGNPKAVTVYGDASVMYHLMRPKIQFQRAIISGSYAFSFFNGVGARTRKETVALANKFSLKMGYGELAGADLVARLQNESIVRIMDAQRDMMGHYHYPFYVFGPTIETKSGKGVFLSERPSKLWANSVNDIPIMLGFSSLYANLLVRGIEKSYKCLKQMSTREALQRFLELPDNAALLATILHEYNLDNFSEFEINEVDRHLYVQLFNDRYYLEPLLKTIQLYNNNPKITEKKLYLYGLNYTAKQNTGEIRFLFKTSSFGVDSLIMDVFFNFIQNGKYLVEPCVISKEHNSGALCPYIMFEKDGSHERSPLLFDEFDNFFPEHSVNLLN